MNDVAAPLAQIDGDRLLRDLRTLRTFGATGTGVVRRSLTPVDMESRRWLLGRMREAGLAAEIDGVGNVIGRAPHAGRALLLGSHTDTQPEGGWLDGAMGVICGLEVARALGERHGSRYAVDIASWMDEEGRFLTCLGSRSFCGKLPAAEIEAAVDPDGESLRDALEGAGLAGVAPARLDRDRHAGYLEAHIEQGPVLEQLGKRLGVVTGIVGGAAFRIVLSGEQNHAGTTPMRLRRDAGMALIELAHAINAEFRRVSAPDSVWTIGDVRFTPGAVNTIAGRSEFFLEFRDQDARVLSRMTEGLERVIAAQRDGARVSIEVHPLGPPISPATMDPAVQRCLTTAAERLAPDDWMSLPSGAGHDAAMFADLIPTGMLFVPSISGISHSFEEDTADDDIVLGCQVLADAAALFLNTAG
jgi:N-carbamoyl-L-amino-acid hydrolase